MDNKAIFLMGPTAAGKTEIALRLAKIYPIEIVSVDSALIYKDLDIGSAKPSTMELTSVPHHLINIISPLDNYSVADFLRDSNQVIAEINSRGKIALLAGGTMMYYNALINGISRLPEANPDVRAKLEQEFDIYGNAIMHQRLQLLDSVSAAKIAINDTQRLERALEVCYLTGRAMSEVQKEDKLPGIVNCKYLSLAIVPENRKLLHDRINLRFEQMLASGFVDEVQQLKVKYPDLTAEHNSMRCVGYRQVWDYIEGLHDYSEMKEKGQAATRQLAKRQITWLRSIPSISVDDSELNPEILLEKILFYVKDFVNG